MGLKFMWARFKEEIGNEIQSLIADNGLNYSDIAILYRNNALSRSFEDVFMKYNIPYDGGISFYQLN